MKYLTGYLGYLIPLQLIIGPPITSYHVKTIIKLLIYGLTASLVLSISYGIFDIFSTQISRLIIDGIWYHKLSSYGLTRIFPNWHPTYVSLFAVWCLHFIIGWRLYYKEKLFQPVIGISISIVLLVSIVMLGSIAAMAALCITSIFLFAQYLTTIKKKVKTVILVVVIMLTACSMFVYLNPLHNNKIASLKERPFEITDKEDKRNFFTIRLAKWVSHKEIIARHFIWGITPGDIKKERKKIYEEKKFTELLKFNFNAHNQYIETMARFGLIGLLILIFLIISPLAMKKKSPFYILFILSASIVFMTESFLERQQGLIAFMFMYTILTIPSIDTNK